MSSFIALQLLGRRRLHAGDLELAREAGERVGHLILFVYL